MTPCWFVITSVLPVSLGFVIGSWLQPGQGLSGLPLADVKPKEIPSVTEVLTGIVPSNIFQSFAEAQVLSVVFVALLVGAGLRALKERTSDLRRIVDQASQLMFTLTR